MSSLPRQGRKKKKRERLSGGRRRKVAREDKFTDPPTFCNEERAEFETRGRAETRGPVKTKPNGERRANYHQHLTLFCLSSSIQKIKNKKQNNALRRQGMHNEDRT